MIKYFVAGLLLSLLSAVMGGYIALYGKKIKEKLELRKAYKEVSLLDNGYVEGYIDAYSKNRPRCRTSEISFTLITEHGIWLHDDFPEIPKKINFYWNDTLGKEIKID